MLVEVGRHDNVIFVEPRDTDDDFAYELLLLNLERTIARWEMRAPEWIDFGGEA